MLLLVLTTALLLIAGMGPQQHAAAMHTPPSVHTDAHMGVRTYSFPLLVPEVQPTAYELRVYLRVICTHPGPDVLVKGFAGTFPVTGSVPGNLSLFSPHFQPPALQQRRLHVASAAGNASTTLSWRGPTNQGLWRFDGKVTPAGGEVLTLEGSQHEHQLLLSCTGPVAAARGASQASPFPSRGLWNVVTTTSANRLAPETLAHLLMLHVHYHERLGVAGAVLRCNKGEAQELALLPHIEALVAAQKLVIWPWVHEHSVGHTPFFWQKPRHQLTLLAAFGHAALRLAFLDLDEYLVLPQGGTLQDSTCGGRPLLGPSQQPAWSFARYSARSCVTAEVDLTCWLDGRAMPVTSGLPLLLERCPCRFHKPILQPDLVHTMSVHYVWPSNRGRVVDVPHACGFIVHLHALVHQRGHFMPQGLAKQHLQEAAWVLPGAGSARLELPGRGNMTAWLHAPATCEALRKAAGKHASARFSSC